MLSHLYTSTLLYLDSTALIFLFQGIFSALSPDTLTYIYIFFFFFILDSGIRVNPTTIRKEIVLSLLMTKTNGPGMIFLVTSKQVGFVRYLEQHLTETCEEILVMRTEEKNPLD